MAQWNQLMRGEVTRILEGLSSETSAAISALQKDAGALGVSIADMADFQSWLKWSGRYRMLTTSAAEASAAQIRALETALEGVQQQSVQPPRESRDYPLPPNQSVMPPGSPPGADSNDPGVAAGVVSGARILAALAAPATAP